MSSWQFQIYLDGAWIDLTNYGGRSLVPREGIDFDGQQHNEGKSVVNTLSFQLVNVPATLLAELYGTPTYQLVPITVTRDGGQYFTGYIRPVDSYSGEPEGGALERAVKIEAVDVLWKLQRTLEAKYSHTEMSVDAIVRDLLELGGFAAGDMIFPNTLTQTVANITEDPDDREIIEILDDLLFEYHHCLVADEHGRIDLFDWLDDGVSSPVGALQETIGREDQEKTDEDYGYAVVSYQLYAREQSYKNYLSLHESKPSALQNLPPDDVARTAKLDLLSKLPDGAEIIGYEDIDLDIWCYISPSTVAYSTRRTRRLVADGTRRQVKLVRSTNESWLYAYCTATVDLAKGNLDLEMELHPEFWYQQPSSTFEYQPTYVTGNFTGDMDIVFVQVWGTVLYKVRAGEAKEKTLAAGERTARREEHESEYLFSRADAQDLAAAIIQLRQYASRRWTRRSTTYIPLGSVVTVDSATLGLSSRGRILRLRDSQSNATDDGLQEYVYTIETLEAAGSVGDSGDEATPSLPAFPVSPITIGDRPTFGDIEEGIGTGGIVTALPTPMVSVGASLRKVSITVLVSSSIVSGTLRFDLQISKNQVDWYALGAGGTGADDWRSGGLDSWTTVESASHSHDSLPLEGTAAEPTSTIYYYRARVRTSTLISDWSTPAAIDVAPVTVNDLQAGSVTTDKLFAGAVTAAKIDVEDLFAQDITMQPGGVIHASNDVWSIEEDRALFSGWELVPGIIQSNDGRTRMRSDLNRFEIRDAMGNVKKADGYLSGLATDSGETFGPDDFGQWFGPGARAVMESGAEYVQGAYNINADAAFVVKAGDIESARLGSLGSGDIGLDIGGMRFGELLGGGGATGDFEATVSGGGGATGTFDAFTTGGGGARYGTTAGLLYSLADDRLYLTGTLVGVDGEFSGSLSAATGTFAGSLSAATGTFSGELIASSGTLGALEVTDGGNIRSGYNEDGDPPASGAGFYLGGDGTMYATGGNFTGFVNATGGNFTGYINSATIETAPGGGDITGPTTEASDVSQAADLYSYFVCSNSIPTNVLISIDSSNVPDAAFVQFYTLARVRSSMYYRYWYAKYYDSDRVELKIIKSWDTGLSSFPPECPSSGAPNGEPLGYSETLSVNTGGDILKLKNLPTSASGLSSGQVWNDSGTLKVVT